MTAAMGDRGSRVSGVPIAAHRLLGDGASSALLRPTGEIDWWCAPALDSPPLLWSLLDPAGARARWCDVRLASARGPVAGAAVRTVLAHPSGRLECWDGLGGGEARGTTIVRLVRHLDGELDVVHELGVGGFDRPWATWTGARAALAGGQTVTVVGGTDGESGDDRRWRRHRLRAPQGEWAALVISLEPGPVAEADRLLAELAGAEAANRRLVAGAKLPHNRPSRAADALRVLRSCTDARTGAAVAAPTTSLPEAPGSDRQFDYRYSWLRDASLAVSVAALIGRRDLAQTYLQFVLRQSDGAAVPEVPSSPVTDVRGGPVPPERDVAGVAGWGQSSPVRVGNAAAGQVQYDSLGLVVEAISVHLQLGAPLDAATWRFVRAIADHLVDPGPVATSGIWELRRPRHLVSADIGRWLALDRAIWIARGWRPWSRRRRWKRARKAVRARILAALDDEGGLPQAYGDGQRVADASALMVVLFGMLGRRDPRAGRLVDATVARLEAWPFLYRYPPSFPAEEPHPRGPGDDGFTGAEGAFIPVSWWVISALAKLGRVEEARARLDALDRSTPRLMPEEIDPESHQGLGNVPLVWSHMEAARALYVLDAAQRRRRYGAGGLWLWRIARYLQQRMFGPG